MNHRRPKILVIRFSSLGDLVLLTALLEGIGEAMPGHAVHLATKERYVSLFEESPRLSHIHTLPDGAGFSALMRLRKRLSAERFDIIIDAHNVIRSKVLYLTLRAPRKVRLGKDQICKLSLIRAGRDLYGNTVTMKDRYLGLIGRLGACIPDVMPRLDPPTPAREAAAAFLARRIEADRPFVALAPGARWETKRWPEPYWIELGRSLGERGLGVVIIGDEHESQLCARISEATGAVDACGAFSLMETAAALSAADVVVTNDSAPLHIAEAVGTPVVALYGPTVRQFGYFPLLPESVALERRLDCRPCSRNGARECIHESTKCLDLIHEGEVLVSVLDILGLNGEAV